MKPSEKGVASSNLITDLITKYLDQVCKNGAIHYPISNPL